MWQLICQSFPQGNLLPTTSLHDFWHTCLKLPLKDMNFGGTILAVVLWSLWTTRNNLIFKNISNYSINSLYFSIFYFLSYWTGFSFPVTAGSSHGALNNTKSSAQGRVNGSIVQLDDASNNIDTNTDTNTMVQLRGSGTSTNSTSIGYITEQLSDEDLLE
jgi:hypothetical protein